MTQIEGAFCLVAAYFLVGFGVWLDDSAYYGWRGMFGRGELRKVYGWPWVLFKGIW
jgi:hypothetical protein